MVLQQSETVPLWGWGPAGEKIRIVTQWNPADTVSVTVNNFGKWRAAIKTVQAGGPYWLKLLNQNGTQNLTLHNVMLGEVWLCSGQSNMEFSANWGLKDGDREVKNADCPNLRIFHISKKGAETPQDLCNARWEVSSPTTMWRTSSIAYFFGRRLSEQLHVPVGIIVSAWGGSAAEAWVPAASIKADSVLSRCSLERHPWWPVQSGVLFNGMIAPLIPCKLAGCIWYQGETNHPNATTYGRLMKTLITSWRNAFRTQFPFLVFQIAPYSYHAAHNTPALLREQQEWLAYNVPDTKVINISDLVENVADIHPKDKRGAGERMANLALTDVYHRQGFPCDYPRFSSVAFSKKGAIITLTDFTGSIVNRGKTIVGFKAFVQGKWIPAQAQIKRNRILISVPDAQKIDAVRYCFDDDTIGTLQSSDGLPVLPFRTDHFAE
jgi:hypothetical protein